MNMFMIVYTYTVRYLCIYVCKGRRQAVHLIIEKECLHSVVITCQSNPPISQFISPCNEFTSVWSMFIHTTLLD